MSLRRAARLASQLPPDGAVGHATEGKGFGVSEYLMLDLIDQLKIANWQRGNQFAEASKRAPFPEPEPRPGVPVRTTKITSASLAAARARAKARAEGR